jgi:hypothetical protein
MAAEEAAVAFRTAVILTAGGTGTRTALSVPKQARNTSLLLKTLFA